MTATNHVTTGALFAAVTVGTLPGWVILPSAFLLHFVLDVLPHYGDPAHPEAALDRLKKYLAIDAAVALLVLVVVLIVHPESGLLIMAAGVLCASPDLWSIARFVRFLRDRDPSISPDWFARFHHAIQREYLWGAWVEVAWFGLVATALWQSIH